MRLGFETSKELLWPKQRSFCGPPGLEKITAFFCDLIIQLPGARRGFQER
jgi:hypothetical protein